MATPNTRLLSEVRQLTKNMRHLNHRANAGTDTQIGHGLENRPGSFGYPSPSPHAYEPHYMRSGEQEALAGAPGHYLPAPPEPEPNYMIMEYDPKKDKQQQNHPLMGTWVGDMKYVGQSVARLEDSSTWTEMRTIKTIGMLMVLVALVACWEYAAEFAGRRSASDSIDAVIRGSKNVRAPGGGREDWHNFTAVKRGYSTAHQLVVPRRSRFGLLPLNETVEFDDGKEVYFGASKPDDAAEQAEAQGDAETNEQVGEASSADDTERNFEDSRKLSDALVPNPVEEMIHAELRDADGGDQGNDNESSEAPTLLAGAQEPMDVRDSRNVSDVTGRDESAGADSRGDSAEVPAEPLEDSLAAQEEASEQQGEIVRSNSTRSRKPFKSFLDKFSLSWFAGKQSKMVHAKNNQSSTLPSSNTSKATEDAVLVNTTAIEVESENDIVEEMPASKLKNSEASADKLDVAEPEAATSSHVDHSPAKSAKSWSVLDPWKSGRRNGVGSSKPSKSLLDKFKLSWFANKESKVAERTNENAALLLDDFIGEPSVDEQALTAVKMRGKKRKPKSGQASDILDELIGEVIEGKVPVAAASIAGSR